MSEKKAPPILMAWAIWGLGATLFMIAFYQRVAPAVMTTELMESFELGAASLGTLSAYYYYSYVAMQIPTGILVDTVGPRRLLTIGCFVAGMGTLLFALAPSLFWAKVGRFFIGGSVAVAFVSMMKLCNHWMKPRQFALATGLAQFTGIIGAVLAGAPLRIAISEFGWRPVMLSSAILPLCFGWVIWHFVRDDPEEKGFISYVNSKDHLKNMSPVEIISALRMILRYRNTWLLTLAPGGLVGCMLTFAGLWGVPFLTTHYGLPGTKAAAINSVLLIAWAIGGTSLAALSDLIGRRKPLYVLASGISALCWIVITFVPGMPLSLLLVLLLTAGIASGAMIIGFAFIKESVPPHLAGTVAGVCNMGTMMGPMILQPAVGWVLDREWKGEMLHGVKVYGLHAYQIGFSLMIVWALFGFVLLLFTKESYCRQIV